MKYKHPDLAEKEINQMIMDIRQFLVNGESFQTNQQYIRYKALFHSFVVQAWNRNNFEGTKYRECNKVLSKKCIEYYYKCWIHRN